ncbi:MAG: 50S ribosomal protein L2 [Candidatus Pelagibacterales bacterium]|tara:strand:+ start:19 stop:861 length:843 start_codon:yes stop_codon:yes gene_type:complete
MPLKKFRPNTPGTRGLTLVDKKGLWTGKPVKSLTAGLSKKGGRNNTGRITMRRKGGGHKAKYRIIDFKRNNTESATVDRIEYDPNRSSYIALITYTDGTKSYILAPKDLKAGDQVISGEKKEIRIGNCMPMSDIPVGIDIHNIELKIGSGAQLARSAGSSTQIVGKSDGYVAIKLPSGEQRKVREECRATIGVLSNIDKKNQKLGKAGRKRWLGVRPSVRGVAMNPIDHPHGGGEGKTSGGRDPVTPWGKPTKGKKTRNNKRTDKFIIKRKTDKKARIEV